MRGVLILASLFLFLPRADSAQNLSVLHIKVTLVDPDQGPRPVPRHTLLISDNPATAAPRVVTTGSDGTADVRLRPGSYTVESDKPSVFHGKAYEWTQTVDIVAGRDATLELTASNAEVTSLQSGSTGAAPEQTDPWLVIPEWNDSVVALWTPYSRATGFVIDRRGLVATNHRAIGAATTVEVQLTPAIKVQGRVLASDPTEDVAVIWIDPAAIPSVRPVPLQCDQAARAPLVAGQDIFAIGFPLAQEKGITSGHITGVQPGAVLSDLRLEDGAGGGPVFTAQASLVGLTLMGDQDANRGDVAIVPAGNACVVMSAIEKKLQGAEPPSVTRLPVEPAQPFPADALKSAVERRAGSLNPYQIATAVFDVAFITPVHIYARYHSQPATQGAGGGKRSSSPDTGSKVVQSLMDFGTWSGYVEENPPVLIVRVTPKLVEGFWTTMARGAARTQGVSVPPIKHPKSGFSRLRAFCGETEVTPIHPFKIEQRVSDTNAIDEGLYVFDANALRPECGTVKLMLYSDKEPDKADTRVVEPALVQQIWDDFAPYRALTH